MGSQLFEIVPVENLLWILLALLFGVWLSVSWILNYHWKSYGENMRTVARMRKIYFVGSGVLFASAVILILIF